MKKNVVVLAALVAGGCAWQARTVGMRDPVIEIVKAMTEAQTASIRAITEALSRAQATACFAPTSEVVR